MKTNRRLLSLCCVICVVLFLLCGCTASPIKETVSERIDDWIVSQMQSSRIPGLAVGIVKGTDVHFIKGYGVADHSGRAVTAQTPFVLASVSKSITALTVMQLAEKGTVNLDEPACNYLPTLQGQADAAFSKITVRHLLNQTSGLSTYTGNLLNYRNGDRSLDELAAMLKSVKLVSEPGAQFHYSNANYVLLANIVEHVTGLPYGKVVDKQIFQPLGMRSSAVEPSDELKGRIALGNRYWFGVPTAMPAYEKVACLNNISTAEDMTHYLVALMNGGAYLGTQICSPAAIEQMQLPAAHMKAGISYAMGIEVDSTSEHAILKHPGDAPGYSANIAILPDEGWGIILLKNSNWLGMEGETGGILNGIITILQGNEKPPSQLLSIGNLRIFYAVICVMTVFCLIRSFLRIRQWRDGLAKQPVRMLRRKMIPLFFNNLMMAVCFLVFPPMAFGASWSIGYLNAPDVCLFLNSTSALLLILGSYKAIHIFRQISTTRKPVAGLGRQADETSS